MVKQGYKQTEVGVIPEDWDVRKIGDFTDATAGGTPSTSHPEYWNGEILWMSSGELNKRRIHNVIGRITELGYNNSSTHMIPENCVLIGLAGQGKTRGTVAVNYVELCTNQSIAAIFPSKEHNSEYLYQNLWSRYEELRELSSGDGGRGGLNLTIIKNFPCAFPKLQEQNRIAEALSDVDELISSLEKLIEKYKSIKATCLQQMFPQKGETTPKMRLPGFTGAWEQRKAIDIADYSKGNGYSKGDLTDAGTPIILYGRLYTKYQFAISEVDTFAVPRNGAVYSQGNEVIVPASGETAEDIARASAVEKSGVLLGGDLNILRPFDFINPLFLALAISNGEPQKELAKKAQGKSVVHIHNTDIQEVTIAYPSRTEQDRIVSVFRQLDNLITLHQRELEKLQNIKKSMLEKMFV